MNIRIISNKLTDNVGIDNNNKISSPIMDNYITNRLIIRDSEFSNINLKNNSLF